MDLHHLAYFVAVAEDLNFTRAARRLHVVQSGVSASIQALERELGVDLFDRTTQRVLLTDAGTALLPEARRTLAAAEQAREVVAEVRGGLRGTLTIGTITATITGFDLAAILGDFHARHQHVTVRLRQSSSGSTGMMRDLLQGTLDLAFVMLPSRPPAGITLATLVTAPLLVVCRRDHPLGLDRTADLVRLASETFIDFPPGFGNRMLVDQAFAAAGLERHVAFEVTDYASAAALVRHDLGIAFLPAVADVPIDDLHTLQVSDQPLQWVFSAATSATRRPSAAVRAFIVAIERSMQLPSASDRP
jgi:DNA-binding transcriptional LysR family regulator